MQTEGPSEPLVNEPTVEGSLAALSATGAQPLLTGKL
jgi:hypothetical protein